MMILCDQRPMPSLVTALFESDGYVPISIDIPDSAGKVQSVVGWYWVTGYHVDDIVEFKFSPYGQLVGVVALNLARVHVESFLLPASTDQGGYECRFRSSDELPVWDGTPSWEPIPVAKYPHPVRLARHASTIELSWLEPEDQGSLREVAIATNVSVLIGANCHFVGFRLFGMPRTVCDALDAHLRGEHT